MQFTFNACHKDDDASFNAFLDEWESLKIYQDVCTSVTDAFIYPEPWTIEVAKTFSYPTEIITSMSTCGLLESWLKHPAKTLGPWCSICSDLFHQGVFSFNYSLKLDKIALELFGRSDCVLTLMSKYLTVIEEKKKSSYMLQNFEMLLSSDMYMLLLNEDEKIQLMAMAIERMKYEKESVNETCHIMIAIMQSCNYTPFVEEILPKLNDTMRGYSFSKHYDNVISIGLDHDSCELIKNYAQQFLNEKK